MGINAKHAITRQLQQLLLHLLKRRYHSAYRTLSWRRSTCQARDAIADCLDRSPSLRNYPRQRMPLTYRRAKLDAADETGLPLPTFPDGGPWTIAPGKLHEKGLAGRRWCDGGHPVLVGLSRE